MIVFQTSSTHIAQTMWSVSSSFYHVIILRYSNHSQASIQASTSRKITVIITATVLIEIRTCDAFIRLLGAHRRRRLGSMTEIWNRLRRDRVAVRVPIRVSGIGLPSRSRPGVMPPDGPSCHAAITWTAATACGHRRAHSDPRERCNVRLNNDCRPKFAVRCNPYSCITYNKSNIIIIKIFKVA